MTANRMSPTYRTLIADRDPLKRDLELDLPEVQFPLASTYAPLPCPLPSALPPAPRLIDPLPFHLLWGQLAACLGEPIAVLSGVPAGRRALAMRAEASYSVRVG